ncbi:MAG: glutathione peroxidase [Bdellovibrionales bacterium]|nr:glutathione peroxidase [Bdellovibrionales bacterium]
MTAPTETVATENKLYSIPVKDINGETKDLSAYKGKTLLIVNTASQCGYTPQYKGLQETYLKYKDKGLVVLGFPSNDFGSQEPGSDAEIKKFCDLKYKVTFPMFSKDIVKGPKKSNLYKFLTESGAKENQGEVSWNFEKFLISKDGKVVGRYKSNVAPDSKDLTSAIDQQVTK